jgi:hypothetical protein
MRWWGYLIFGLVTVIVAPVSALFALANPVTSIMIEDIATPALRLLGFKPPTGWSGIGSAMFVNLLWPLTLAPLHWLNYRVLRWNVWSYVGLILIINMVIACAVLLVNSL